MELKYEQIGCWLSLVGGDISVVVVAGQFQFQAAVDGKEEEKDKG